jgi:hypothetical protein
MISLFSVKMEHFASNGKFFYRPENHWKKRKSQNIDKFRENIDFIIEYLLFKTFFGTKKKLFHTRRNDPKLWFSNRIRSPIVGIKTPSWWDFDGYFKENLQPYTSLYIVSHPHFPLPLFASGILSLNVSLV